MAKKIEIKTVNSAGQICVGKKWAKQQIQVEEPDDDTLVIRRGLFIPNNERWLHQGDNIERLNRAVADSKTRPRSDNFEEIKKRILADD